MSISGEKRKTCQRFLFAAAFTALFGFIYERFSHEVYSAYMMYAFLIPLLGGFVPSLFGVIFQRRGKRNFITSFSGFPLQVYESGLACLTVGSLMEGVLEIYGTTNRLIVIYLIAGAALAAAGIVLQLVRK